MSANEKHEIIEFEVGDATEVTIQWVPNRTGKISYFDFEGGDINILGFQYSSNIIVGRGIVAPWNGIVEPRHYCRFLIKVNKKVEGKLKLHVNWLEFSKDYSGRGISE